MVKIKKIKILRNFDSRGQEVIKIGICDQNDHWFFSCPGSGKSKGKKEVISKDFQEIDFDLISKLEGKAFSSLNDLEDELFALDGSPDKSKIGGNIFLALSLSFARAFAWSEGLELWEVLKHEYKLDFPQKLPLIFSNVINGGAHVENNLDIQEYMVVLKYKGPETVRELVNFYRSLGDFLREKYSIRILPIGDESGYALDFENNLLPLVYMKNVKDKFSYDFEFALDCAANYFYHHDGHYFFETQKLNSLELTQVYLSYKEKIPELNFIEDPFQEEDFEGFKELKVTQKFKIIGDDLTVTNPQITKDILEKNLIDGIIIKANQVGSLRETFETIKLAKEKNLLVIISHRSGETEDPFLIHIAKACGADALKIGVPIKERVSKFNELVRIYGEF